MKNQLITPLLIYLVLFFGCLGCNKKENSSAPEKYGWQECMTGKILHGLGNQLFVIDANGTKEIMLSEEINSIEDARWSPDGSKIVFVSNEQGIVIVNQDGTEDTLIINNDECKSPVWSPDGSRILSGETLSLSKKR